ncbi:MAG: type II toxin-antitoxin system RelE/ParE family toxin [Nitrospirae bacterium]|nr:type II toxin-antitoxin system RelE/ParE family toxin [Nitrospirota bacterium]MBF0535238.1 type II toxin-antitoxin system RelE/ParE family toxin [Nitrospirota bacterium]MBF0615282.1 type II toxin-antitoxin system RelE/ParE family toxin [Nitrospirota bacterium]
MEFRYRKQFLKDLASLPAPYKKQIEYLVFEELPLVNPESLFSRISKMKGYDGFYKVKKGDFRIGLSVAFDKLEFRRVLHRRDIYRFFP